MKLLLTTIALLVIVLGPQAQNTIGLPDIVNYPKKIYAAGLQNWDIQQDSNGIIYIANNEGLLCYDGQFWNLYPLPNRTIARSLSISNDQRIYVGGQDELGFFAAGPTGRLSYRSLTSLIPAAYRSFGDVWDIVCLQNEIWFRTSQAILRYTGKAFAVYKAPTEWGYMGLNNNRLYAQDMARGLMLFENNAWRVLQNGNPLPANDVVTGLLTGLGGRLMVAMQKNGLFWQEKELLQPLSTPLARQLKTDRIYSTTRIDDNRIAMGTSNGGVYIVDNQANLVQHFSSKEGLQNNNVLSIFADRDANLWLGLDNGIDFIAFNSAIKQILPSEQKAAGYTTLIRNGKLYIGTSNGAYVTTLQDKQDLSFSQGRFLPIGNTTGQVWSLQEVNDQILLGHHEGAFRVDDTRATPISGITGFWNFMPTSSTYPSNELIAGNYKGVQYFSFKDGRFAPSATIPTFQESSRYIAIDALQNIWISHPYHGVFRVERKEDTSTTVSKYDTQKGLPSLLNNHVFKIKEKILAATEQGIYQYEPATDTYVIAPEFKTLLGNQSIRYLKEDAAGNIWFFHEKNLGVIEFAVPEKPTVTYLSEFNNRLLSGFEFIYPYDKNNIFLAGETGIYHLNFEKYKNQKPQLGVSIRSVRIGQQYDSLIFGGYAPDEKLNQRNPAVDHNWKNIRFEFAAPPYPYAGSLEYSYRLVGYDSRWSEWTKRTDKEFTNLPQGDYRFEVKVRNNLGAESAVSQFAFTILPAWYTSKPALAAYLLILSLAVTAGYRRQQQKFKQQQEAFETEQKRILYIHELERNKAETELMTLRNVNLESEIQYKNSELASSAMHLVKKGELISKIKTELNQLAKRVENTQAQTELKKMIKALSEDEQIDQEWDHFAKHFDKVHSDFVIVLKNKHPEISPSELKLCAYLRMNLSSKEIAQLLNISVRGVEISRYRLRKKLNLATGENLFDYLIQLQKEQ
jgi:ligand-binding sensor domain-containing protein/DNA-binding CsgD family transcriptional regulator